MSKTAIFITTIVTFGVVSFVMYIQSGRGGEGGIGLREGNTAPPFHIRTIDNRIITSDDVQGKLVVITSSAAWCGTCVIEAQQLSSVFHTYKDQGVFFLTIDIDQRDSRAFIEQFRRDTNTPWDYADVAGASQFIDDYNLYRFEITYVMDKDGVIRYRDSIITNTETLSEVIDGLIS